MTANDCKGYTNQAPLAALTGYTKPYPTATVVASRQHNKIFVVFMKKSVAITHGLGILGTVN